MDNSDNNIRKIAVVSSTRADWGLLSPIAGELSKREDCNVTVIATNMHLSQNFGMTVNQIISDGFTPVYVEMECDDDSARGRIRAMAQCMTGMSEALEKISPDLVLILGDRYEMLAVASAAVMMRIPIVHIAGGTISEGAIDDSIRHAITKLAALHLTETEEDRRRVIAMGEQPDRVINTGAIGVWNINNITPLSREQLGSELDFDFNHPFVIATFHPATLDNEDSGICCRAMLDALDRHPELNIILTYPNNDPGSASIINEIESFAEKQPQRVRLIISMGAIRYLSALRYAEFTIGNSSSGIVEVASAGIPSIDIGRRQHGRAAAESVIHCGNSVDDIDAAINLALSPDFKKMASMVENPYYKSNTLQLMVDAIMDADPACLTTKHFYDIRQ